MKGLYFVMPKGKPIDPQLKTEIVSKIRNDGMSVSTASAHYGVNAKSIYYWLRDGVVDGNRNLILENNKLKKELEIAYRIIGRFTAESQRPKAPPPLLLLQ
jgi:transposase-like protein